MRPFAALLAALALASAPAASLAATKANTTTTTKTTSTAGSKMKGCASQWKAMSAGDKGKYSDRAKGMKSKKGGSVSGYNVWTGECMKKA